jgi:hypothetical protein
MKPAARLPFRNMTALVPAEPASNARFQFSITASDVTL